MKRLHCIINGKVQNCGFRSFCWDCAEKARVSGWVANDNNCVSRAFLEVQGESEAIEKFFTLLKKGNGFCKVNSIDQKEIETVQDERRFTAKWCYSEGE